MRFLPLCLLLGVLPGFGDDQQPTVPIALYLKSEAAIPPAIMDALHDEVESIMSPSGVHFAWRKLADVKGNEVSSELAVVTFKGRCSVDALLPKSANPGALGWTHISDGVILPFTEVDCDRLRTFLQRELLYLHPEDREEAFGRAIGRVLAHELYHIFANTTRHGADGVGKSAYTTQELLSDDFQFQDREFRALKTNKAVAASEAAGS